MRSVEFQVKDGRHTLWVWWSRGFEHSSVHVCFEPDIPVLWFQDLPHATASELFEAFRRMLAAEPVSVPVAAARERWGNWAAIDISGYRHIALSASDAEAFLSERLEVAA